MSGGRSAFSSWLELSRAPNLLTVPGDPAAGFILALAVGGASVSGVKLVAAMLASLALYLAGLYLNDVRDSAEDARDRPQRPIPSGRIGLARAKNAGFGAMALGLAAASFAGSATLLLALVLASSILAYTFRIKDHPAWGPINMGLCRGLSFMMGAAAGGGAGSPMLLASALLVTLYIGEVSRLAREETEPRHLRSVDALLPGVVLLLGLGVVLAVAPAWRTGLLGYAALSAGLCAVVLVAGAGRAVSRLIRSAEWTTLRTALPRSVGLFLGAQLFVQAALIMAAGAGAASAIPGAALCLLWPVNRWLGRRFYAS